MMNMFWEPLEFEVPADPGRLWRIAIDTFQPSPRDIADEFAEAQCTGRVYAVRERSVVVLVGRI